MVTPMTDGINFDDYDQTRNAPIGDVSQLKCSYRKLPEDGIYLLKKASLNLIDEMVPRVHYTNLK